MAASAISDETFAAPEPAIHVSGMRSRRHQGQDGIPARSAARTAAVLERSHLGCDCSSASRNGQDGIPARKVGGATSSASAGKILYWRAINRVDVDDARYLDLEQLGAGGAGLRVPGSGGGAAPAKPVSRPVPGT